MEDITEALWGTKVSPSTVSKLNQEIYERIEQWRSQPLQGSYPYVFISRSPLSFKQVVPFSGCFVDNEAARFSARVEVDDASLFPLSRSRPGESFRVLFPCLEQCLVA